MKTVTVSMHFGDGSFKTIEMEVDESNEDWPIEVVSDAKDWVNDNAWFELDPDQGQEDV